MKKNTRSIESLSSKIKNSTLDSKISVLLSPSDIGVRRNYGRNGTRYGPQAIINILKRQNNHLLAENEIMNFTEVSSQTEEKKDFHRAQDQSASKIKEVLTHNISKELIHIGGGHDHAYPLLKAINEFDNKVIDEIIIINIDAHCDTRKDDKRHSGTPFRDFDSITNKPTTLYQFGIQKNANSLSTLMDLKNIDSKNIFIDEALEILETKKSLESFFMNIKPSKNAFIYISLDCDAIEGSSMKAVSAVNGHGLPLNHTNRFITTAKNYFSQNKKLFGLYEFNPIYDDISQLSARGISSLIYNYLLK